VAFNDFLSKANMNLFRKIPYFLLVVFCFMQAAYGYLLPDTRNLYKVKKIYLAPSDDPQRYRAIEGLLKMELEMKGFVIVDDAAKADAILSGEIQAEVTLDGNGRRPNKSTYLYQLTAANKEVVWKGKVRFVSNRTLTEDHQYAAKRIAEMIARDWQKSVKNAAAKP
jgi:hypothetical protein